MRLITTDGTYLPSYSSELKLVHFRKCFGGIRHTGIRSHLLVCALIRGAVPGEAGAGRGAVLAVLVAGDQHALPVLCPAAQATSLPRLFHTLQSLQHRARGECVRLAASGAGGRQRHRKQILEASNKRNKTKVWKLGFS